MAEPEYNADDDLLEEEDEIDETVRQTHLSFYVPFAHLIGVGLQNGQRCGSICH